MFEDYKNMIIKKEELSLIIKDKVIIDYSLEGSSGIFDVITVEEGANPIKNY